MGLLVDALAVHRLTVLVTTDKITEPVREKIWEKHSPESGLGYLITCPWCSSMWLAFGAVAARRIAPKAWDMLAHALALSTVAGLIEEKR